MIPAFLVPLKANMLPLWGGLEHSLGPGLFLVFSVFALGFFLVANVFVELLAFFLVYGEKADKRAYSTVIVQNLGIHLLLIFFLAPFFSSKISLPVFSQGFLSILFAEVLVIVAEAGIFYFVNKDTFSVRESFTASFLMNVSSLLVGFLLFSLLL